jgi:hypothetical protein
MQKMRISEISGASVSRGYLMKECIFTRATCFEVTNYVFPGAH